MLFPATHIYEHGLGHYVSWDLIGKIDCIYTTSGDVKHGHNNLCSSLQIRCFHYNFTNIGTTGRVILDFVFSHGDPSFFKLFQMQVKSMVDMFGDRIRDGCSREKDSFDAT